MTLSELILDLERLRDAAGDLEVMLRNRDGCLTSPQSVFWAAGEDADDYIEIE